MDALTELETKTCPTCRDELPATREWFHLDKRYKDGFCPRCKACEKVFAEIRKEQRIAIEMEPDGLSEILVPAARALFKAGYSIGRIADDLSADPEDVADLLLDRRSNAA